MVQLNDQTIAYMNRRGLHDIILSAEMISS